MTGSLGSDKVGTSREVSVARRSEKPEAGPRAQSSKTWLSRGEQREVTRTLGSRGTKDTAEM